MLWRYRQEDYSDGLLFAGSHPVAEEIRESNRYEGIRIRAPVQLGSARVTLQIDLGFGDAVYPPPRSITLEPLLNQDAPEALAHPLRAATHVKKSS